ncbi:hypothetical protein [Candidatus Trichorickettsia mobilis]|uniref:hypothetical protein n=1 Tax=Candidatus Trichorickettsia mobilis TaxID=1346319 RepID=UPI00292E7CE2|nr:hypothetical protein [Candidatus Trichorickettsia mobilis]
MPIVVGAVTLGLKVAKTAVDANKAIQTRKLNEENNALVDYATQAIIQKEILKLEPKLDLVKEQLQGTVKSGQPDKASKQELTLSKGTALVEKVLGILERTVGTTGAVITNPAQAAMTIGKAVGFYAKDTIIGEITKTPELRAELVRLINNERNGKDAGYDNIQDLQEQTRKLKIDNAALKETIKGTDVLLLTSQDIQNKFIDKRKEIEKETPEVRYEKQSGGKAILQGIGDALNPYSQFNVKEHSGLVKATRKEEVTLKQEATIDTTNITPRPRAQSMSDISHNSKGQLESIKTDLQKTLKVESKEPTLNNQNKKQSQGKDTGSGRSSI